MIEVSHLSRARARARNNWNGGGREGGRETAYIHKFFSRMSF